VSKCEKLRVTAGHSEQSDAASNSRATSSLRVRTACLLIESRVEFDWRAVCGVTPETEAGRIPNPSEVKPREPRARQVSASSDGLRLKRGRTAANCTNNFSPRTARQFPPDHHPSPEARFRQHTLEKAVLVLRKSRPESRFVIASQAPRKAAGLRDLRHRHEQYARTAASRSQRGLLTPPAISCEKWRDNNAEMNGEVIGGSRGLLDSVQFALRLPN